VIYVQRLVISNFYVVKFQVKLSNFDGMSKSSAVILEFMNFAKVVLQHS